jgi:signal transduction histidine kinase
LLLTTGRVSGQRAVGRGLGLPSMRERAEAIGAAFQVTSKPGQTCVEVRVAASKKR